ncbi:hypothetical protein G7Y89_g6881 [Cudoniella acicularis]|uniref:Telomere replication protein EST3 n=1 Tax=Cudoniella acicularis TaxID=354080 RepID=A0A8H4RLF3_9HELO|nr:hypothetical protein G7Y89_g6881 [Cudoniella acicularis]
MSNIMRDWIRPVIEGELSNAYECFRGRTISGQKLRKDHRICEANRLIINIKSGRRVQITKFHERNGEAFNVTVSDGTTCIRATIPRQDIEERHRGGVISISEYNLLVLDIKKSKFLGSEGSEPFGRPQNVWEKEDVRTVVGKLKNMLQGIVEESPNSQPTSPILPQEGSTSVGNFISQTAFATQMPVSSLKRRKVEATTDVPQRHQSGKQDLLNLLNKQKAPPVFQDQSNTDQGLHSRENKSFPVPAVLSRVTEEKALRISSRLDASANAIQGQLSMPSQLPHCSGDQKSQSSPLDDKYKVVPDVPISDESEKENSQESVKRRKVTPIPNQVEQKNQSPDHDTAQMALVHFEDQFMTNNPFDGMKRVPRTFVRISTVQRDLLERKEAWFNPATDSRSSYATIPVNVQQDLNKFINRTTTQGSLRQNEESGDESDDSEDSDESDDESKESMLREATNVKNDSARNEPKSSQVQGSNALANAQSKIVDQVDSPACTPAINNADSLANQVEDINDNTSASDDLGSDAGSQTSSWASSHYEDTNAATTGHVISKPQRQISSSSDDEGGNDEESVVIEETSAAYKIHGTQNSNNSPPELPRINTNPEVSVQNIEALQALPMKRIPIVFSSSPIEDDGFEIDILHAVGDVVEQNDVEDVQVPETSQELPSSAPRNPKLVQVEQTPYLKTRDTNGETFRSASAIGALKLEKGGSDEISSDYIVPATCNDIFSRTQASNSTQFSSSENSVLLSQKASGPPEVSHSQRTEVEVQGTAPEEVSPPNYHSPTAESSKVQNQVVMSLSRSNTILTPLKNLDTSKDFDPTSPQMTASPGPPGKRQEAQSSSIQQSSAPEKIIGSGTTPAEGSKKLTSTKRKRRILAAEAIRHEECITRDIKEMARSNRHKFYSSLSANETESARISNKPHSASPEHRPATAVMLEERDIFLSSNQVQLQATDRNSPAHPISQITSSIRDSIRISENDIANGVQHRSSPKKIPSSTNSTDRSHAKTNNPSVSRSQFEGPRGSNFYDSFKIVYSGFKGSLRDFTWTLVYIEWLRKCKQLLHRSLCDDFIRVLASDYIAYINEMRALGTVSMTGWQFYDKMISQPEYQEEFITPDNLQEALSSLDQQKVQKFREQFDAPNIANPQGRPIDSSPVRPRRRATFTKAESEAIHSSPPANNSRAVSPERGSTIAPRLASRLPFFETPSQLDSKGLQRNHGAASGVGGIESNSKPARRLPWLTEATPKKSSEPRKFSKQKPPAFSSSPSIARTYQISSSKRKHSEFQGTPASPILGSDPQPSVSDSSRKRPRIRHRNTSPGPPNYAAAFKTNSRSSIPDSSKKQARGENGSNRSSPSRTSYKTPSLSALRDASSTARSTHAAIDDVTKVKGWLNAQQPSKSPAVLSSEKEPQPVTAKDKKSKWKAFLKHKRRSGGFESVKSTPNSTPMKRFCTKEVRPEPETQAWEY